MAETQFFGPWRLVLDSADPVPQQSFVIADSDNADGRHLAFYDQPLDFAVQGADWRIKIEYSISDQEPNRIPSDTHKEMAFLPQTGLTVILDTRYDPSGSGAPLLGMRLLCVSLDPEINPEQSQNPYDFTIPQED
jgi:hypothetical protein